MSESQCIECGERVGGSNHTLLSTNRASGLVREILDN